MQKKFRLGSGVMCAMAVLIGFAVQARSFEFKQFKSTGSKANSEYYLGNGHPARCGPSRRVALGQRASCPLRAVALGQRASCPLARGAANRGHARGFAISQSDN